VTASDSAAIHASHEEFQRQERIRLLGHDGIAKRQAEGAARRMSDVCPFLAPIRETVTSRRDREGR